MCASSTIPRAIRSANDKAPWERAELNLPIRQHDVWPPITAAPKSNLKMAPWRSSAKIPCWNFSTSVSRMARSPPAWFFARAPPLFMPTRRTRIISVSLAAISQPRPAAARISAWTISTTEARSAVSEGHVSVVRKDGTEILKRTSRSPCTPVTIRQCDRPRPDNDDFDRWVSGRADSVVTATNAAMQYSQFFFVSGGYLRLRRSVFLRRFLSPFRFRLRLAAVRSWHRLVAFRLRQLVFPEWPRGWSFIGNQPWGWLPYHYGGWLFEPGIGWLWAPTGFGGGLPPVRYHPVTATFRAFRKYGRNGSQPPNGQPRKDTVEFRTWHHARYRSRRRRSDPAPASAKWKVVKEPRARLGFARALRRRPGSSHAHGRILERRAAATGSAIVYDAKEHRFVNGSASRSAAGNPRQRARRPKKIPPRPHRTASGVTGASGRQWQQPGRRRVSRPFLPHRRVWRLLRRRSNYPMAADSQKATGLARGNHADWNHDPFVRTCCRSSRSPLRDAHTRFFR